MKQRLLVMNGSRILQREQGDGQWENQRVEKANGVKPGIYNIYLSKQADKTKEYSGAIIHADKTKLYQMIGKDFVVHNKEDFEPNIPSIGQLKTISYDKQGKAVALVEGLLKTGLSR
ncbi:conjugal transfer protein TraO [Methylomonas sp. Kb3]|uniref:KfrB domain-containing protein n=1 Tax=Methylomonas sp. Kb3 TaxID=1611544 RepID=UPI000C31C4DB|nr:KfrB domain-containing protein [Methylomonas sp. Kb3]PKD40495.1 conjugal transfer protein TraO [Methylomonas sp. Kb3]